MRKIIPRFLLSVTAFFLAGCAALESKPVAIQPEEFNAATYSHSFAGSEQATCEAARRALLSQGYMIEEAKSTTVKGRKNFQPGPETHVQIEFNVVCAANSKGSNTTTAFATALQDKYTLKKNPNSASVGVSVLGSVSLPFGATSDSLVKIASETIQNGRIYNRFFTLMERYMEAPSAKDVAPANSGDDDDEPKAADKSITD